MEKDRTFPIHTMVVPTKIYFERQGCSTVSPEIEKLLHGSRLRGLHLLLHYTSTVNV